MQSTPLLDNQTEQDLTTVSIIVNESKKNEEKKNTRDAYTSLKLITGQAGPQFLDRIAEISCGFINNLFLAWAPNPNVLPASGLISTIQSFFMSVDNLALSSIGGLVGEHKDGYTLYLYPALDTNHSLPDFSKRDTTNFPVLLKHGKNVLLSKITQEGKNEIIDLDTDKFNRISFPDYNSIETTVACIELPEEVSTEIALKADLYPPNHIGKIFRNGIVFSTIMGIPTIGLLIFSKPILDSLQQNSEITSIVQDYFRSFAFGIIPGLWLGTEKQLICGFYERPYSIIAIETLNSSLTTLLAYFLINGTEKIPALGAAGLGYADAISTTTSLIICTSYLACNENLKKYNLFSFKSGIFDRKTLCKVALYGLPLAVQFGVELGAIAMFSIFAGKLGSDSLSAQQISMQYVYFIVAPIISLSRSNLICIAQAKGRKDSASIKQINFISNCIGLGLASLATLGYYFFRGPLVKAFLDKNDEGTSIMSLSEDLIWMNTLTLIPDAVRYITGFSLVPLDRPGVPMVAGIFGLGFIAVPLAYILGFPLDLGLKGLALARGLGVLIGMLMVGRYGYKAIQALGTDDTTTLAQQDDEKKSSDDKENQQDLTTVEEPRCLWRCLYKLGIFSDQSNKGVNDEEKPTKQSKRCCCAIM